MLFQWSEHEDVSILEGAIDLNKEILSVNPGPLLEDIDLGNPRDKLIYIYTSGTTGMPKAAVINNLRYLKCLTKCFLVKMNIIIKTILFLQVYVNGLWRILYVGSTFR